MTAQFIDISSYQSTSIDWQAYKQWSAQGDGISRVAIKATEGTGFVDPSFAANRAAALAAGIDVLILYHFGRPDLGNTDIAEASFMQSVVGDIRPQDIIILDYEVSSPLATAQWALGWLVEFGPKYGKLPGIYASSAYIAERLQWPGLNAFPLWLANWQYTPDERPPVPAPWTSYEFVQYSDKAANIPGVPGLVDADIFLGGTTPMANIATTIDITTPGVSTYFKASSDDKTWQCTNGNFIGGAILDFYKGFGGSGLCGLSWLGIPDTNEIGVTGHPGVVYQRFERGVAVFDPSRLNDSPPGVTGQVYLAHIDSGIGQDPQIAQLQSQITALKTLPASANLQAINGLVSQASTAIAQAGITIAKIGPLSQVQ